MRVGVAALCAAATWRDTNAAQQNFTVTAPTSDSRIGSSAHTALRSSRRTTADALLLIAHGMMRCCCRCADFLLAFELPGGGAVNGSFTMTFERVSGAADPYSPHVVTFANSTCAGGAHSFDFTDFSIATDELEQVVSVTSAGGRANDLAHNGVYRVIFVFSAASSNYTGPTRVELSGVARTDFLWLFGIGASICGSFGVGTRAKRPAL